MPSSDDVFGLLSGLLFPTTFPLDKTFFWRFGPANLWKGFWAVSQLLLRIFARPALRPLDFLCRLVQNAQGKGNTQAKKQPGRAHQNSTSRPQDQTPKHEHSFQTSE